MMSQSTIESLFWKAIEEKAVYNKLTGISEDKIYNWKAKRGKGPSISDMLGVLYQLDKITVHQNEPTSK